MEQKTKLKIMEHLYNGDRGAAEAVGVSWDAWRRWRIGERKMSVPIERLIDRLILEAADKKVMNGT